MVLRIGHRGAAGYEPENTLRSFQKALDLEVDMIELDVHACKTGELMVFHDYTVERITNGTGEVAKKTVEELKLLDVDGERIPMLEEVLNFVDRRTKINIELKGKKTAYSLSKLIDTYVEKGWGYDDFLVSSFNYKCLSKFHELTPAVKIGMLVKKAPKKLEKIQKLGVYSLHLPEQQVTPEIVGKAHEKGLKVFVFTVNEYDKIERMKQLGVDGIFSDYPDRV